MRKFFVIIGILILFFLACILLQQAEFLVSLKTTLHSQFVHGGILNFGTMGKTLKQMGVVKAVPNDDSRFPAPKENEIDISANIFQKKRSVEKFMYIANSGGLKNMPSSLVIGKKDFKNGWPLLSIVAHKDYLYSSEKGIITNSNKRGQEWEHLAYVSYYENGKLDFASGVGLRLHGGASRGKIISFRLYFREEYGGNQFKPGILFGPETEPLKTLVVHDHNSSQLPFIECLAHDIARQIGCVASETKPVIFFLNGESQGIYYLIEHLSIRQWKSRFGHENFLFYKYRSKEDLLMPYRIMRQWIKKPKKKITMKEAGEQVDIDNLSRFVFSFVFNGDDDWNQGAAMLDLETPGAKWFWINWDMDRSFTSIRHWSSRAEKGWQRPAWKLTITKERGQVDLRSVLFTRLRKYCPEYRKYFIRMVMDILNHNLTNDFLQSRIDHYEQLAISYGVKDLDWFAYLRDYMEHRPGFVMRQMHEYFGTGEIFLCRVKGPAGLKYEIDGYPEESGYQGRYFKGKRITIEAADPHKEAFLHWLVNGKKVERRHLRYKIDSETVINPVFNKKKLDELNDLSP